MKKLLILLLLPLFALSCSKEESEKELILSKNEALIHSCRGEKHPEYCHFARFTMADTIVVLNGKGKIRVEPEDEYVEKYNIRKKISDVLNITTKSDTIFITLIWDDVHLYLYETFNVYDEDNGFATFTVNELGLI